MRRLWEGSWSRFAQSPRIAVVHDFLYTYAGAERVLEQILEVFPQAQLFSLFDFLPRRQRGFLRHRRVTTSFIQHLPLARKLHRLYLPLMPIAIEQLDVRGYDIVISSSYLAAKGVRTAGHQLHICYCHTPARFAWDLERQYLDAARLHRGFPSALARLILHYFRNWDVQSANPVDVFVTNSNYVARRIKKTYRREAVTIYPPVDTEQFCPGGYKEDFYLTVGRLAPYKRVDLLVRAFNGMPCKRLVVIGDGPDLKKIKRLAQPNVTLLGHQPAETIRTYMQRARAFVFAAEEDFGIAPVEAQACATPVIAYGRGGAVETVIDGKTGMFFWHQSSDSIVDAIEAFERRRGWDTRLIRSNAERFSTGRFRESFVDLVWRQWREFAAQSETSVAEVMSEPESPELIGLEGEEAPASSALEELRV